MLQYSISLVCCTLFLLTLPAHCQAGQQSEPAGQSESGSGADSLKGRRVLVITNGAEIKTREGGTVWNSYVGEVLTVSLVQGDWLWVFEHQGWLNSKDVVPWDTAVFEMNERIRKSPRAENYALRGIARLSHADYLRAIEDFNEVLRRNPNDAGALVNRGNAWRFLRDEKKAIADYTRAITMDPRHFLALNNRAIAQTTLKNYERARKDLVAAIALNPKYAEAHNNLGIVFQEQGKLSDAVAEFTRAIELDKRYALAFANRGNTYARSSDYEKARADLSQAVVLAPNDPEILNDLAWFLATCPDKTFRDPARAIEMAETATRLAANSSWNILHTCAAAHAAAGDFEAAQQHLTRAIALAPKSDLPQLNRQAELLRQGKPLQDDQP